MTAARGRDLVLARVGRRSLHQHWLDPAGERTWDLRLVPYEDLAPDACRGCDVEEVVPGPKWTGLRTVLERWDGWREYDHVWLPDDDVLTDARTITRLFEVAASVGLDLFAPALHEASHFAHFDTMRNPRFSGRWVGFVEIMVPGFRTEALARLLPTLRETETGWGWGLDSLWPKLLGYRAVGVVDETPVLHTRPVGAMRDGDLARRVLAESDRIMESHDCGQVHRTFAAFGPDHRRLDLDDEELLSELVGGWQYLIDRDPRLLAWIAEYQRPADGWPTYPVAGTP